MKKKLYEIRYTLAQFNSKLMKILFYLKKKQWLPIQKSTLNSRTFMRTDSSMEELAKI